MNADAWVAEARERGEALRELVATYHPAVSAPAPRRDLPITAPGAETACRVVREHIREGADANPAEQLDAALATGDANSLYRLLNEAWFGVPESTGCWRIPGFAETVSLLEDPPDEEEACA